ncbi:hypothetical protein BLNAU_5922 [Blattamonas nauphoetae]|uniref:Uncharacterized protein n=1 Tax=Blattamonas nauphoetae TaxID=2049346 RepID=A0ABQ9Y5U8_9EUKA|nr:hypothetical protein BLNAU_5922 [Blattamonas nauphoetae]
MDWIEELLQALHGESCDQMSEIAATAKGSGALFLNLNPYQKMPFKDKSKLYNSLVSLVKVQYPFDDIVQYKVVQFLEAIRPDIFYQKIKISYLSQLVPDDNGPCTGFNASIFTLLSSSNPKIVSAGLSFLASIVSGLKIPARLQYLSTEFISTILTILQPHTLPIASHTDLHNGLMKIIKSSLKLATPTKLTKILAKTPDDRNNICEVIYNTVVVPSSQYLSFLVRNRYVVITGCLSESFQNLLSTLLQSCPSHVPILECFISHSIVTGVVSLIPFVEEDYHSKTTLTHDIMESLLPRWKRRDLEVSLCGKRMAEALRTEGLEDSIEQTQLEDKDGNGLSATVLFRFSISERLGFNVRCPFA